MRKFLVPIAAAIVALLPSASNATTTPSTSASDSSKPADLSNTSKVIEQITYRVGGDEHLLLMKQTLKGDVFAQHGSHYSHGSHGSHSSHASHRSGY